MGITQDFSVNPQFPTRVTLAIYRGGSAAMLKRWPVQAFWKLADPIWTRTLVGAELPFSFVAWPAAATLGPWRNYRAGHPRRFWRHRVSPDHARDR